MKNGGVGVWEAMRAMVGEVEGAIRRVEERAPEAFSPMIWERVVEGMREQVRQFEGGMAV